MGFLDLLFPKRCVRCRAFGDYLCPNCFALISFDPQMICLVCGKSTMDGLTHPGCRGNYRIDGCFAAVSYTRVIKKLLYAYKYKPYLSDIKSAISELFFESCIQQEMLYVLFPQAVFVPIPLHPRRLRARGYDQVQLLTGVLSQKTGVPIKRLLQRVKETKVQYGLKREERMDNLHDAFTLIEGREAKDTTLLLVDDIVTSGTTLAEAARILKRGGYKKVYGLAFAHGS